MTNEPLIQEPSAPDATHFAANMLIKEQRTGQDVIEALVEKGYQKSYATQLVEDLQHQVEEARRTRANKDMLYGALWCVGGIILTMADIGYIFWGAIIFGAIQFFKGVANQ